MHAFDEFVERPWCRLKCIGTNIAVREVYWDTRQGLTTPERCVGASSLTYFLSGGVVSGKPREFFVNQTHEMALFDQGYGESVVFEQTPQQRQVDIAAGQNDDGVASI